jgi:hypothetical protein
MNNTEKLDDLLKYFYEKDTYYHISSHDIRSDLKKYSDKELTLLTEKLILDKYLSQEIKSEHIGKIDPPYSCRITFHGSLFWEKGGFESENKRIRLKTIKIKASIIASVLNAIIIIVIAFISGILVPYHLNKEDEKIKDKDKQIEMLSAKIDSLITIQKTKNPN